MTAAAAATRTGSGLPVRLDRPLQRVLAWIDTNAAWCCVAGLALVGGLAWYVTWHVPHSTWLFTSQYAEPFKDLYYRIGNVRSVERHGVLYFHDIAKLQYFVYPPAALWMFWPLTWVTPLGVSSTSASLFTGELLWTLTSILALALLIAAAARYACRWRWAKCWAVSLLVATPLSTVLLVPVGVHLALGQVGLYLAALATFDILCVRNRARGVLTGITAAIKLYPIIYFFLFALRREWRALGNAVGALLATTAIAWAVFPSYSATYFFHRLLSGGELRHYWHNPHWISSSSSIYTVFFRQPFTGTPWERDAGFVLCLAVLALGIVAARRQLREGRLAGALLSVALASTIGSPVAWDHYFFWVVLAPFVLVERGWLPRWRTVALAAYGLACLVPLRLARNENLSHTSYDWRFLVIFTARDAFIVVSLLWLVTACVPQRADDAARTAAQAASDQARTSAEAASGVRP